ncbi:MAG: hypothetical protein ACXWCQ_34175, partial [Burkholderiales bacterium]
MKDTALLIEAAERTGAASAGLALVLTPHGHLILAQSDDADALPAELTHRLEQSFARGSGHGLLQLGSGEVGTLLPPVLRYWRDMGVRYVTAVCTSPDLEEQRAAVEIPAPPSEELRALAEGAPPMRGAEYLTASVLEALWSALNAAFRVEL